jgi:DNA-binding SARP family transcriptional activator
MARCAISLFGGFELTVDGRDIPASAWRHRRAADLVKLLSLADGHRLHREQAMDALWPDLAPEAAGANLRKAVHFARRALESDGAIVTDSSMVSLWPEGDISVDVEEFEDAARAALRSSDEAACELAADLCRGELLPEDRYALWADEPRERLRLLRVKVLKAGRLWDRVLDVDPTDEEAHRALMELALDADDRREAIRQFERLRGRLRVDLGMGPDQASIALYERALAMDGDEPPSAAEQVSALVARGLVSLHNGDIEEAERQATEARALASDAELGHEIGEASALLGLVANMGGRWKDLFRSEFIQSVRTDPGMAAPVFDAHLCLAEFCLCGPAGHEDVASYAGELLKAAEEAGSTQGRALATLILGEADLFSDRLDAAEEKLTEAAELYESAGGVAGRALATQRLAEVALARGQRWKAERLLSRSQRLGETSPFEPHLLVRTLAGRIEAASDDAATLEAVRIGDEDLTGRPVCRPCSMGYRVAASIALARAGALTEARQRLDETERLAGMWQGGPWLAAVWEARAVLRRAEGNDDQAAALFREAAAMYAEVGRSRDAERCTGAAKS